jgi:hypothetical protein
MLKMSVGRNGRYGSKKGESDVGCVEGNVETNCIGGDAIGVGEMKSLGITLGTNDTLSLGTIDGTNDTLSLGTIDGTNDELGTMVELGVDESASTSTATGDGARDIMGSTSLRALLLPAAVELLLRLSEMTIDNPTTAPTTRMTKTINPMGSRTTMIMIISVFL